MTYEALVARAAGLSTHLLGRDTLHSPGRAAGPQRPRSRARRARRPGLPAQQPSATELELAVAATPGSACASWRAGIPPGSSSRCWWPRPSAARSAPWSARPVEGARQPPRRPGAHAQPGRRELGELSRQATLAGMVALLTTWRSPWAEALARSAAAGSTSSTWSWRSPGCSPTATRSPHGARAARSATTCARLSTSRTSAPSSCWPAARPRRNQGLTSTMAGAGSWMGRSSSPPGPSRCRRPRIAWPTSVPTPTSPSRILTLAEDPVALERGIAALASRGGADGRGWSRSAPPRCWRTHSASRKRRSSPARHLGHGPRRPLELRLAAEEAP